MHFSWLQLPTLSIRWTDILEIIILSFFIYHFLIWIRRTRTWVLLKGLLVLVFFISLAYIFEMDTIKFLITKGMDVAMVAAVIVFQPELRRALEQLGEQKLLSSIVSFDGLKDIQERFSDRTVEELIKELGTRHRAGVGISEVTDSMTIIVSEETGKVSIAENGRLIRSVTEDELRKYLMVTQDKSVESQKFKLWKGKGKG